MPTTPPDRLELRNRLYVMPKRQQRMMLAAILILLVLPVVAIAAVLLVLGPASIDWSEAAGKLKQGLARNPWDAAAFSIAAIGGVLQVAYLARARRYERLVLTGSEIRYESPLPQFLQFLQPSWSLAWSEVSRACLRKSSWGLGPLAAQLVLVTPYGKEHKTAPYRWVDPEGYEPESPWQALRKARALKPADLQRAVAESPAVRLVAGRFARFEMQPGWAEGMTAFALEKNPRSLAVLVLFFALVAFGLTDTVVNDETYAAAPPWAFYVSAGVLVAALAWLWLGGAAVPVAERTALALLAGGALGAALYPGLLRVNQFTDSAGLQTWRYVLHADLSLTPLESGPPPLRFVRDFEYWQRFPRGSTHDFRLRRGALGFYQIDMRPLYEDMRRFYWKNKWPRVRGAGIARRPVECAASPPSFLRQ